MENHLKTSGESLEYKTKDSLAANMEMSQECAQIFQDLKLRKKHRYIIYKMGQETFEIDVIGERNEVLRSFFPIQKCSCLNYYYYCFL